MTKRYAVHNLRCAGCAARIEDAIAGLPGVKSAAINLDSARLRVDLPVHRGDNFTRERR